MTQLWTPSSYAQGDPKSESKPRLGPSYGNWSRDHLAGLQLPGGGLMQFDLSRLTLSDFRAMRDHYQINIALSMLAFTMHGIDWQIECESDEIKSALETDLAGDSWTRMIRALSPAYWAGYAPIALEFENGPNGRVVINKFKDLVPEECRVNWNEVEGYAPPNHPPPKLREFGGIKHEGSSHPIPPEHSLWYPLLMENGNFYGRKLLRPAFAPWFFSQLIHLFANRYFERFGEPLPVGRAPFDADVVDPDGNSISGRQAMENVLTAIRNRSVAVLPADRTSSMGGSGATEWEYQIEYLESQMRGADFERYLSRLDEEMSLGIFTPLLLVRTADVGSYNLGELHIQTWNRFINALTGDMAEYINRSVIRRLTRINFGPDAPEARWVPRSMGKDRSETIARVVTTLISSGLATVDVDELGAALGLTVLEIEKLTDSDNPAPGGGPLPDNGGEDNPAPGGGPIPDSKPKSGPVPKPGAGAGKP